MSFQKTLFVFFSLVSCSKIIAQDLDFKHIQVDLTYFGNQVTNPGGAINADWSFLHTESRRNVVHRRDAEITNIRHNALNLNLSLSAFYQKPIQTLSSATAGLSFKRISGRLFVYEIGANAGYSRTFLAESYAYSANENDFKFTIPGAFYITYHYYLNFGRYFRKPFFIKGWTSGISVLNLPNLNASNSYLYNIKLGVILR